MEELKKKYLFVKKVRVSDEYKTYIVSRHYEKELTQDELVKEIQDIQGERPLSYAYMEISGDIRYQGLCYAGLLPVKGGHLWGVWDVDNSVSRYFKTTKECIFFVKQHFTGEYRRVCLMLLAHQTGRAKVKF